MNVQDLENNAVLMTRPTNCCGTVLVRFVDLNTNKSIRREEVINGPVNFPYCVEYGDEGPQINGYTFQSVSGCPNGIFTPEMQTVIYYYVRNCGVVLIKFREICTGQNLRTTEVLSGEIGTRYTATYGFTGPEMPGYRLVCVRGPVYGTYRSCSQTVTYYYKKCGPGPVWMLTQLWPFNNG